MAEKVTNLLKSLRKENKLLSEDNKFLSIENKMLRLLIDSYASFLIKHDFASSVEEANIIVDQEAAAKNVQSSIQLSLNFPNFR